MSPKLEKLESLAMGPYSHVVALAINSLKHRSHTGRRLVMILFAFAAWLAVRLSRRTPVRKRKKSITFSHQSSSSMNSLKRKDRQSASDTEIVSAHIEGDTCPAGADRQFGFHDDRFERGEKVSTGSQGVVYECTRLSTKEQFAAKIINCRSLEDNRKKIMLLKREICIMRELHHPKIVNIITAFWEKDSCTIVMDLARGGDLYKKLEFEVEKASDEKATFAGLGGNELVSKDVAQQLLVGIHYMHKNHVVHRDLKLENILITETRAINDIDVSELHNVKIADFGLSTVLNSIGGKFCSSLHVQMSAVGTPAYVAPEVLEEKYDQRVDFWSFGVILYALICGQMPFTISSLRPDKHKQCVSRLTENDSWELASLEAQSFIRGLLNVNAKRRLNFTSCCSHAWLVSDQDCLAEIGGFQRQISPSSPGLGKTTRRPSWLTQMSPCNSWCANQFDRQVSPTSPGTIIKRPGAHWQRQASNGSVSTATEASAAGNEGNTVGVVTRIVGVTGSNVHCSSFCLLDGEMLCYGDEELDRAWSSTASDQSTADHVGQFQSFELEEDEYILGVMQAPARGLLLNFSGRHLGDALVFYTSASRTLALEGTDARRRHRYIAPAGWQIVGLQFEGSVLTGTHVERADPGADGSIAAISGRTGAVVNQANFTLRGGSSFGYGTSDGHEQGPYALKPKEQIVVVEQGHRDQGLGASLAFYTSLGNVHKLAGVSGTGSLRFAAPSGSQVCGLSFENGALTKVQTCSLTGDLSSASWCEIIH